MKHLFIPYELALIAKEKGFNEPCFGYHNIAFGDESLGFSINGKHINSKDKRFPSAPLYQQIVDWFREEHSLEVFTSYVKLAESYITIIGRINGDKINLIPTKHKTYYEALNKAIEEAFKLI